jgi:hypothetical protein
MKGILGRGGKQINIQKDRGKKECEGLKYGRNHFPLNFIGL